MGKGKRKENDSALAVVPNEGEDTEESRAVDAAVAKFQDEQDEEQKNIGEVLPRLVKHAPLSLGDLPESTGTFLSECEERQTKRVVAEKSALTLKQPNLWVDIKVLKDARAKLLEEPESDLPMLSTDFNRLMWSFKRVCEHAKVDPAAVFDLAVKEFPAASDVELAMQDRRNKEKKEKELEGQTKLFDENGKPLKDDGSEAEAAGESSSFNVNETPDPTIWELMTDDQREQVNAWARGAKEAFDAGDIDHAKELIENCRALAVQVAAEPAPTMYYQVIRKRAEENGISVETVEDTLAEITGDADAELTNEVLDKLDKQIDELIIERTAIKEEDSATEEATEFVDNTEA